MLSSDEGEEWAGLSLSLFLEASGPKEEYYTLPACILFEQVHC